jgi:hypothetical protein
MMPVMIWGTIIMVRPSHKRKLRQYRSKIGGTTAATLR